MFFTQLRNMKNVIKLWKRSENATNLLSQTMSLWKNDQFIPKSFKKNQQMNQLLKNRNCQKSDKLFKILLTQSNS